MWGANEEVNFVNTTIIGNKLEVGPSAVRLVGGELVAHELQRIPLPRILRLGYCDPILRRVREV